MNSREREEGVCRRCLHSGHSRACYSVFAQSEFWPHCGCKFSPCLPSTITLSGLLHVYFKPRDSTKGTADWSVFPPESDIF